MSRTRMLSRLLARVLHRAPRRAGERPRGFAPDRRRFLRGFTAAAAAVTLPAAVAAAGPAAEPAPTASGAEPRRKRRWGMVIDLDRCSACGACSVACREENNVPSFGPDQQHHGARPEWMSMCWREGEGPTPMPEMLPLPCQHCEDPPCVKVCPVGATYKDHEGITIQVWDRCIGCRYCMVACPYSRRSFNWETPRWSDLEVQMLNPDVATRPRGVVEKCTFCHHRLQRLRETTALEGREPRDDELQRLPACAAACPASAITFGDLEDLESKVSHLAESPRAFRLLEHLGTKPAVTYLKRDRG